MTNEEILEGNKLIAQFMQLDFREGNIWEGGKQTDKLMIVYYPHNEKGERYPPERIEYESNWQHLMPVVEKVWHISEELDGRYKVENEFYQKFYSLSFHSLHIHDQIEIVYKAVIQFISWYNTTKQ